MHVVVVESPAKAKTIRTWLGRDYKVIASYGHVSDLAAKEGSVKPDGDFAMVYEETGKRAVRTLGAIAAALRKADSLILATDPDREGEAIAWQVVTWLRERDAIGERPVRRVVFHEVTPDAVREAMARPRDIDMDLVNAQQARRALDYLVGYGLSRVLWRKLPGGRSAGRVQSVALRLVCAREAGIEVFAPQEYWTVDAEVAGSTGSPFTARLSRLDGVMLDKLTLDGKAAAQRAAQRIRDGDFRVEGLAPGTVRRTPTPPFTTSTLQQDASRRLGFGVRKTMQIAQALYEGIDVGGETVGLITYMRTDSVALSKTAVSEARRIVRKSFGAQYLPRKARVFRARSGNEQEAHEAIRPIDFGRTPEALADRLDADEARLYELVWKRALASQMTAARLDRVEVEAASKTGDIVLAAAGSAMAFDGFLRVYREAADEEPADDEDRDRRLPELGIGEALRIGDVRAERHVTGPPPRYTEAGLVRRLEELGIGRPSTYAAIVSVLQERDYVVLLNRRFVPLERGRVVTAFLEAFFDTWVAYGFTNRLEQDLDRIARGGMAWKGMLHGFWGAFHGALEEAGTLERETVLAAVEGRLEGFLFGQGDGPERRTCPACGEGELELRLGRYGPFVGCRNYPECGFRRRLAAGDDADYVGPKQLGTEPGSGLAVTLRRGPNGYYVQMGESGGGAKPARASVPKAMAADEITLDIARSLLALPREVGVHPESGGTILAGIGRYGPWVRHGDTYASIGEGDDVLTVGLNRAVVLLAEKAVWQSRSRGRKRVLRELGVHPDDGAPVWLKTGHFGPFIAHRRHYASVPEDIAPDELTLEQALELLARASGPGRPGSNGRRRSGGNPRSRRFDRMPGR